MKLLIWWKELNLSLLHAWYHWEKVGWPSEIPTVKLFDKPIIHKELPIRISVCPVKYGCAVTLEESLQNERLKQTDKKRNSEETYSSGSRKKSKKL